MSDKKRVTLAFDKRYKLYSTIEARMDELQNKTLTEIMKTVQPDLEFTITKANVKKACIDLGIKYSRYGNTAKLTNKEQIQAIKIVAKAIANLYVEKDITIPCDLRKLLDKLG